MPAAVVSKFLLELLVVLAAFLDLRQRRIPNWLTLPGILIGFVLNIFASGWPGLRLSLLGFLLAFAIYGGLFALRAVGGGDVKLMLAVAALTGPERWLWIFLMSALASVIFAFVTILGRGGTLGPTFANTGVILGNLARLRAPYTARPDLDVGHPKARTQPHGAAIAVGTLVYCLWLAPR